MRHQHWIKWVAFLVLTFGPLSAAKAVAPPAGGETQRHRLQAQTEEQQGRVDRLKQEYCGESESDRCRLLGDLDVSLKEVRGELESSAADDIRLARKELGSVRRSLDSLDPESQRLQAE